MTDKRFNYVAFDGFEDNGEYITPYEVVKLLNEQHETIQRLEKEKLDLSIYNQENEISALKEINKFKKENEQLKKAIDEADDLIKSHLSAHYNQKWENICEYLGVDFE